MKSAEIRNRFLKFFESKDHTVIPSASLVPENDSSVLFNTAGMQPLVPYLLGEKHPAGKRIVDVQKCVRTTDIDDVGDKTHLTFFEMLGNWSLGDYFKEDALNWSYEFLTDEKLGLGLDPKRLYVTVFEGNEDAPKDEESYRIWKKIFEGADLDPEKRIFFMNAENNWWQVGDNGPCGPDSEMFYDATGTLTEGLTKEEFIKADDEQKVVEIWNNVFMEYIKKDGKVTGKLPAQNVDTGAGLERMAIMLQGKDNVYDTDAFSDIMDQVSLVSTDLISQRVIADHFRTAVFMIADGVSPANSDAGYILRRILRRSIFKTDIKSIDAGNISTIVDSIVDQYGGFYKNLEEQRSEIKKVIEEESNKFVKTISQGLKQFEKLFSRYDTNGIVEISGKDFFNLFQTYGFPVEMTIEEMKNRGILVDEKGMIDEFNKEMKKHQELSSTSSAGKFKGGLAGQDEQTIKYHTTAHLLHQALREVLGEHVIQRGSNITSERARFDFVHPEKMTDEEKQKVEEIVNAKIGEKLSVTMEEMTVDEAKAQGALGVFDDKYTEKVKVYSIGNFSKEICGGPHVENIGGLGTFKIKKEESVSAGVRRIKAILESKG